jgi:hypothetical protein
MSYGYSPNYPRTQLDLAGAEPTRRSGPPSVQVAALIQYLLGLSLVAIGAAAGALSLGFGQALDVSRYSQVVVDLRGIGLTGGSVFLFAGLVVLAIGRKVQRGRQWARVLVVMLSAISVAGTLYNGLVGQGPANALFGLVFPVLFLVLLNLPAARSWFRAHTY